jgi:hypothetical protein
MKIAVQDANVFIDLELAGLYDLWLQFTDPVTGLLHVKRKSDGKIIKVADLVDDDAIRRDRVVGYLRKMEKPEDMDLIIALGTRDSVGKKHAQFTNLIAQPDAKDADVAVSVNNMLKAITCSLLMEQVLAPVIKFKPKQDDEDTPPGEIRVKGLKAATTERVRKVIETKYPQLTQDEQERTTQAPGKFYSAA